MKDRWLSVEEIGTYLGVKRDTFYNWISERNMPPSKVGPSGSSKNEIYTWGRKGGASEQNHGEQ